MIVEGIEETKQKNEGKIIITRKKIPSKLSAAKDLVSSSVPLFTIFFLFPILLLSHTPLKVLETIRRNVNAPKTTKNFYEESKKKRRRVNNAMEMRKFKEFTIFSFGFCFCSVLLSKRIWYDVHWVAYVWDELQKKRKKKKKSK